MAGIKEYKVAITAAFGASAIAGNNASPSLLIELPSSAEKGNWPFKYIVVTKSCGPQPGIMPINTAIRGTTGFQTSKRSLRSHPMKKTLNSYRRKAEITQKVTKQVSFATREKTFEFLCFVSV